MGFATLLAGAGTGLQAFGKYQSAQDEADAEDYNAQVARQEAEIAKQKGILEANKQRRYNRKFLAQTEVAIAKSGVAFSGSALEVWKDNAEALELDAMLIEYNSKIEQQKLLSEAQIYEENADRTRFYGAVGAATTVLQQSASFLASQGTQTRGQVAKTGKTQK